MSLNVCEKHCGEAIVIFNGRFCPLCIKINENEQLEKEIGYLQEKMYVLETELNDLKEKLLQAPTMDDFINYLDDLKENMQDDALNNEIDKRIDQLRAQ